MPPQGNSKDHRVKRPKFATMGAGAHLVSASADAPVQTAHLENKRFAGSATEASIPTQKVARPFSKLVCVPPAISVPASLAKGSALQHSGVYLPEHVKSDVTHVCAAGATTTGQRASPVSRSFVRHTPAVCYEPFCSRKSASVDVLTCVKCARPFHAFHLWERSVEYSVDKALCLECEQPTVCQESFCACPRRSTPMFACVKCSRTFHAFHLDHREPPVSCSRKTALCSTCDPGWALFDPS